MKKRQVIVVGAGIGGSTCAHYLAKAGVDVLLLEKAQFPRDKVCGDGQVPGVHPILKEMGIYDEIRKNASLTSGTILSGTDEVMHTFPRNEGEYCFCTPRYIFDHIVNQAAIDAGVDYIDNFDVTEVIMDRGWAKGIRGIHRGKVVEFESDAVVVANGSHSMVARDFGFFQEDPNYLFFGIRGYFENVKGLTDNIEFHYPAEFFYPAGYIWLFPMSKTKANVGVFLTENCLKKSGMTMEEILYWWRDNFKIGKERLGDAHLLGELKGWRLPTWGMTKEIHGNGVLAVGDAANMIEPLYGGGTPHAMIAGKIAAGVLAEAVKQNNFSKEFLQLYRDKVNEILGLGYDAMELFRKEIFTDPEDLKSLIQYGKTKLAGQNICAGAAFKKYMIEVKGYKGKIDSGAYSK